MLIFKLKNEKVCFRHVVLYEFEKKKSEYCTCYKNIQDICFKRDPVLRTMKQWFCRIQNGDLSLKDEIRLGLHYFIYNKNSASYFEMS